MTALVKEEQLINKIATHFDSIEGIKSSYGYAQNPDSLTEAQLPAVMFFPAQFRSRLRAHHNWRGNEFELVAVVFAATRQSAGGRLKFIENRAIPFMGKVREKFQDATVTRDILGLGFTSATTFSGTYGAGGPMLTHNGIEYIGCVFTFNFVEIS